jgi:hypothetical protein
MRAIASTIIALGLVATTQAEGKGPIHPFSIGNWHGGGFTDDSSGQFSHCVMSANYQSGITLHVSVTSNLSWLLGFSNPTWRLTVGQPIPVDLTFDGRGPLRVSAVPRGQGFAVVEMPPTGPVISAFRNAHLMMAFTNGSQFGFALKKTDQLLPALVKCVQSRGEAIGNIVAETPRRAPTPIAPQAVVQPRPTENRPTQEAVSEETQAERKKLLENAALEYHECIKDNMVNIVPYSNESAEILSQVITTKCKQAEDKFVSLGVAIFNVSKDEMKKIISSTISDTKNSIITEIVTFRAESAKAKAKKPSDSSEQSSTPSDKIQKDGI